jgi:hypothetical protein
MHPLTLLLTTILLACTIETFFSALSYLITGRQS